MFGLDHHGYAGGAGHLLNRFGDLPGQGFLDLQAPRIHVDDARDLRQPEHLAGGDVGDMRLADKRQQVMLAQRVQLDVLDDHHLIVVGGEQRAVDHFFQALLVTMTKIPHGLGGTFRRVQQAFALRIFTHAQKYLPVVIGQLFVHRQVLAARLI
ncbi:hypothetical protein D9M68_623990 [compost metagenome]